MLSTKFDPAKITAELGQRFELMSNMYKPFACGLGSGLLLRQDVSGDRLLPEGGELRVRRSIPDTQAAVAMSAEQMAAWRRRLIAAYASLNDPSGAT